MPVYPGWLTRAGDQDDPQPWRVRHGAPHTDIRNRRMSAPAGEDTQSRVLRIRELVKSKFSPESVSYPYDTDSTDDDDDAYDTFPSRPDDALMAACEQARINVIASGVLDDVRLHRMGDELNRARMAASSKDWVALRNLIVSLVGTTAMDNVVSNLTKELVDPNEVQFVRSIRTTIKRFMRMTSQNPRSQEILDYEPYVSEGFMWTVHLAQSLYDKKSPTTIPRKGGGKPKPGRANTISPSDEELLASSGFAELIEDHLHKPERVAGRLGRRRIATDIGANPRRIQRMLTDPDRRIFDRRARSLGGVVLIDQSGSMSLETDDVWKILRAAPGCTVIGYSHRPGSTVTPNIWVLAHQGKVVSEVRPGNIGNGVDGPALLFALRHRKNHKQPFIWVCDGVVTDSSDGHTQEGSMFCANLVRRHRIHMVPDVSKAIDALNNVSNGKVLTTELAGPLKAY